MPAPPHDGPPASPWLRPLGRAFLALNGWRVEGGVSGPKGVVLGVPHTSNWDFVYLVAASWVFGVELAWIGKHTLFRPPLGWLLRALGGIPVDRSAPQGLVGQIVAEFDAHERLFVTVPPSGTRGATDHWKSGFYWMAREAGVPIVLGYLDYGRKIAGLGPALMPTGDVKADMDVIRAFYADKQGRYPHKTSRIRLRDEDRAG